MRSTATVFAAVLATVVAGAALWLAGMPAEADLCWALGVAVALVPLTVEIGRDLRHGKTGVDLIALLAMAGSLALEQYLAGAVVGLMLSGGQSLESYAGSRARRELSALVARAPKVVHRYEDGRLTSPDINTVRRGDRLLVKPGEIVPVDGVLSRDAATLDESAITGEARPVERHAGERITSGVVNAGGPFDIHALGTADESTYAGIIRLVREATAVKAPFVRLADRYAMFFLPLTLAVSAAAWTISGSPIRALAVLVVATPCPLILAAPVAIVAGISRAASRGVIVKGGGALETLADARTLVFDKTGTLTSGAPAVAAVEVFGRTTANEVLRLAGSLDQVSAHVFANAIVAAARSHALELEFPAHVHEEAGHGIKGTVAGHRVAVGKARWLAGDGALPAPVDAFRRRSTMEGLSTAYVAIDGHIEGVLILNDPIRGDTPAALQSLRQAGVNRIVVLSGDRKDVTVAVGRELGVDDVLSERTPAGKVQAVLDERDRAVTVMVGDGINDAPALAAADVGIAMGARGSSASSEAADVVIVLDRLDRVVDAIRIARRARSIAVQSVVAGMALSAIGMALAMAGILAPVAGAVFQEAIDVAVVLNALRALGGGDAALRDASRSERADQPCPPVLRIPIVDSEKVL